MAEPTKRIARTTKSPDFLENGMRRWREPSERKDRDNRPGHYSIAGAFIELSDSDETTSDEARE
jgi:hypothetical protein